MSKATESTSLHGYRVWERPVRLFHWINVICVIGLIGVGLVIYFNKNLGVSGDGKILLKTIHVYIGYLFALNLMFRFVWFFLGNQYARLSAVLPFGKAHRRSLSHYLQAMKSGNPPNYLGHNPVARLMVALLFLLLTAQMTTGLVLAGTDLYMPPFGSQIAEWVSETGNAADVTAGSKVKVNEVAYAEMRSFRKPFITVHKYAFNLLLIAIVLHVAGVAVSEIREGGGLVSALFTGKKVFAKKPVDFEED